jgi:predicted lipoprotein with Yx(FWY)xxD motif
VNRINLALVLLALAAALLVAGCGSSSDGTSGSSGGAYGGKGSAASSDTTSGGGGAATAAPASGAIVSVGSVPGLGRVLVDAKGFTLYDFHKDKGTTSSCYGGCAEVWPPLVTEGEAQTSNGAMASKLGTTQRKDGTTQVTYAGHPLYTYVEDKQPGDSRGNDFSSFGAQWYALAPSGAEAGD